MKFYLSFYVLHNLKYVHTISIVIEIICSPCAGFSKMNEAETFEFIKCFEEHDCLWRKSSPSYKDRNVREAALREIGLKFNLSEKDAFVKFRNLRTSFYENYKKSSASKSGSAGGTVTKPKWRFYEAMMFLKNEIGSCGPVDTVSIQNINILFIYPVFGLAQSMNLVVLNFAGIRHKVLFVLICTKITVETWIRWWWLML